MDNLLNCGGKYIFLLKDVVKQMYEWGIDMDELKKELNNSKSFIDAYRAVVKLMEESPVYEAEDIEKNKHQIVENIFRKLMDDLVVKVPYESTGECYEDTHWGQSTHGGIHKVEVNTIDVDFTLVRNMETEDYQDCQLYLDPENYDKVKITISRGTPDDIINNISYIVDNINEHTHWKPKKDIIEVQDRER